MLDAVGWASEATASRLFAGGASLVLSAPIDALYSATEVNEWALDAAVRSLSGEDEPATFEESRAALSSAIEAERKPRLLALEAAAREHGVSLVACDRFATAGLGRGSRTWTLEEIPETGAIDWSSVHDVPVALVTGTNGKTTTVRMAGAILREAGLSAGLSTTDRVTIGDEIVASGDYSGPEGARMVLRDRRVDAAVLETARGGLLRRGLPLRRAAVAVVTNVADDHLGEFGVRDLEALADVKCVVSRAVSWGGKLVLNADDPMLVARAAREPGATLAWFTLDAGSELLRAHLARGGTAAFEREGALVLASGGAEREILRADAIPCSFGGAARHVVANALAAILATHALGIDAAAMARGLASFDSSPEQNPGRSNVFAIAGATVLVDFAHNPHGLRALLQAASALPARRRLVLIGQAGDRDDASIRALAREAWAWRPDRIIVKEMPSLHRGRAEGEIPAILEDELGRAGAPSSSVSRAAGEIAGVEAALAWAQPGDLLVLPIHSDRKRVLEMLRVLAS